MFKMLRKYSVNIIVGLGLSMSAQAAPEVTRFWLVDTATDMRLQELENYQSLPLPILPNTLSIEAEVNGETESVVMKIENVVSSTENLSPYSLVGDNAGDFDPAPVLQTPGWLDVSATPYSLDNAAGVVGDEVKLTLYMYQPDFYVTNPADVSDYNPGDGVCSITAPLGFASKAVVSQSIQRLDKQVLYKQDDSVSDLQFNEFAKVLEKDNLRRTAKKEYKLDDSISLVKALDFRYLDVSPWQPIDDWIVYPIRPLRGCTLRAAIEESNALAGTQSILVNGEKGPFLLSKGSLNIEESVTINGYELPLIDAQKGSRVFYIYGGEDNSINVSMRGLDIANGEPGTASRGGAIFVGDDASLNLSESTVRDSRGNFGGGIYVQNGRLTVTRSAIHDNTAGAPDSFGGGGITQRGGGISGIKSNITVNASSIYDNRAVRGGGISNFGGTVRLENTTVIDNEAMSIGGGIENHHNGDKKGNLHISFTTIAHNAAGMSGAAPAAQRSGGGIYNTGWTYMASSVLSNNSDYWYDSDPHHAPDCYSPDVYDFKSFRNNIVGVLNDNCSFTDYSWGNQSWIEAGTAAAPLNSELNAFRNFWDHAVYYMPKYNSLAIDEGASQSASLYPCPSKDVRGRPRPSGEGCDIGAVERQ